MPEMTIIRLLDPRPGDVPSNFPIFNAPRPLIGAKQWSGDFQHDIFYAAVDITLPGPNIAFEITSASTAGSANTSRVKDVEKWGRERAAILSIL